MAVSAKLLPTACHPVCTGPRGYSSPEAGLSLCGHDVPAHTLLQLVHVSPSHPLVLEVTNVGPWPPQPSPLPSPKARTLPPLLWAQPGLRALIQDQQFHGHLRDLLTRCLALTNEDPAGNEKLKAPFDLELLMEVVRGRWALLAGNARCRSPHPAW